MPMTPWCWTERPPARPCRRQHDLPLPVQVPDAQPQRVPGALAGGTRRPGPGHEPAHPHGPGAPRRKGVRMTTIIKRDGTRIYEVAVPQTGQIAFYRDYKEPLVPLDRGFGYEGVLLYDISLQKVQCHFCGE